MIIVVYTDECLLYARDTKDIGSFVKKLECRPLYRTVQNTDHSYQTCENF
jgi:hypothetical protein